MVFYRFSVYKDIADYLRANVTDDLKKIYWLCHWNFEALYVYVLSIDLKQLKCNIS